MKIFNLFVLSDVPIHFFQFVVFRKTDSGNCTKAYSVLLPFPLCPHSGFSSLFLLPIYEQEQQVIRKGSE